MQMMSLPSSWFLYEIKQEDSMLHRPRVPISHNTANLLGARVW